MKEKDAEKLRAFEEWLSDVGHEEKKTIQRNGIISVIVRSGKWWRVFTSEAYSIRSIIVHLNRYCPDYQIVAIRYGFYPTKLLSNYEWLELSEEEITELSPYFQDFSKVIGSKEYILSLEAPYRDKVNLYYIACSVRRAYPSKRPFDGVPVEYIPYEASIAYGTSVEHPFFVADADSVYSEPSDIMNHYDGKRVQKTVYGQQVSGYVIEHCRLEYKKQKPAEEHV